MKPYKKKTDRNYVPSHDGSNYVVRVYCQGSERLIELPAALDRVRKRLIRDIPKTYTPTELEVVELLARFTHWSRKRFIVRVETSTIDCLEYAQRIRQPASIGRSTLSDGFRFDVPVRHDLKLHGYQIF